MVTSLTSKIFTFNPTVHQRLVRCANDHSKNIHRSNDSTGDHVTQIQEALIFLMPDQSIDQLELKNSVFGSSTADAVFRFKNTPQFNGTGKIILGPGQTSPDRIVGKQTIVALDAAVKRKEGGTVVPPPQPEPEKRPQDIFVYFRGAPEALQGQADTEVERGFFKEFNTAEYLKTHQPVIPICFFGGRGSTDVSSRVIRQVQLLRSSNSNGVTIVRGDSVGGLIALKTAAALSASGIHLNYVAIDDAAFSMDEVRSFDPLAFEAPTNITADLKENYFQKFGHEILADKNHPNGFLPGTEFHGSIPGFLPIPVEGKPNTSAVVSAFERIPDILKTRSLRFRVAANAHEQAHKDADPLIDAVVRRLMTSTPTPNAK